MLPTTKILRPLGMLPVMTCISVSFQFELLVEAVQVVLTPAMVCVIAVWLMQIGVDAEKGVALTVRVLTLA